MTLRTSSHCDAAAAASLPSPESSRRLSSSDESNGGSVSSHAIEPTTMSARFSLAKVASSNFSNGASKVGILRSMQIAGTSRKVLGAEWWLAELLAAAATAWKGEEEGKGKSSATKPVPASAHR